MDDFAHDPKKIEQFFEQIEVLQKIYDDWKELKAATSNLLIPLDEIPQRHSQVINDEDGTLILIQNDAIFMGYCLSYCEFSDFFIELAHSYRISGNRCLKCNDLIVPPIVQNCPRTTCNFHEMKKEFVNDVGALAYTTPIVLYPPRDFKNESPYALGWIIFSDKNGNPAATYLHMRLRTTQAFLTGGIFNQHIPVKVAFARNRQGTIRDIFAVPTSELTHAQIEKSPLFEDEIEWQKENIIEIGLSQGNPPAILNKIYKRFEKLETMIEKSKKAQKNLAGWEKVIRFFIAGFTIGIKIYNGELNVFNDVENPDILIQIEDPQYLLDWLIDTTTPEKDAYRSQPLSNLLFDRILKMNRTDVETLTKLDRLERSLKLDYQKTK